VWAGQSGSKYGLLAGSCEHGNEQPGSRMLGISWAAAQLAVSYYFGFEALTFVRMKNTALCDVMYYGSDFFLFNISLNA
jgi:hypothetical protein